MDFYKLETEREFVLLGKGVHVRLERHVFIIYSALVPSCWLNDFIIGAI